MVSHHRAPVNPSGSKGAILDAATDVFMNEGFSGARVDDIARRARANKAMIYYHFGSKQGLYKATLLKLFGDVLVEIARLKASKAEPLAKLRALYTRIARHFTDTPALPHIMLRELLAGGKAMDAEAARTLGVIVDFVSQTLAEGVKAGQFRKVHPLLLHKTMLGPLMMHFAGASFRERVFPKGPPGGRPAGNEEMLSHLLEVLDRALAPDVRGNKIQKSRERKTK
ncbi:MAG: TetR/AcrR family transcriptional regulator [Vicinamibacteria bacterium]